jgi:mutator protein MutT
LKTVDTVSFILIKDSKILVERRRNDRINDPGAVVVPGGHVDPGETHIEAVKRELYEEVGVECDNFRFFDRMLCESDTEYQMNSWFICEDWVGEPLASEADEIFYLCGDELDKLSLPNDRLVIKRLFYEEIGNYTN